MSSSGSRAALALIAILCGGMGFVLAMVAMPAQSTALAADGLIFLRESALAWLAMWVMVGAFRSTALIARILGLVMILLGAGVLAIAWGRLNVGSAPDPASIAGFGAIALVAQLISGALALRHRGRPVSLGGVLRATRDSSAAHLTVIAAGAAVLLAKSNLGDIIVGAAIAAMFTVNGLAMLMSGRLAGPSDS